MIYGATGYTGRLIAARAVELGLRPVLAGRDDASVRGLATDLGCDWRAFPLTDPAAIMAGLKEMAAVLHCAGPFSATAVPMLEACLAARAHYLDITGEIEAIEAAHQRGGRARDAGIVLLPAVGMDVAPSDCLAARLASALPSAARLQLAFYGLTTLSRGTAATVWENIGRGGRVRQDGRIIRVPVAWKVRQILFASGPRWALTIPWGDVASAFYTTGIPNIEVYAALPHGRIKMLRRFRGLAPVLGLGVVQAIGRSWIRRTIRGPSEAELSDEHTEFWGRVEDASGHAVEAFVDAPNGYALTVQTSLAIVQRVLAGDVPNGFSTPAAALGGDFLDTLSGVAFTWGQGAPRAASDPLSAAEPQ